MILSFQRNERMLLSMARLILGRYAAEAEDVMQNAMIKAWINRDSLRNESQMSSWLRVIVKNESFSYLRKMKSNHEILTSNFMEFNDGSLADDNVVDRMLVSSLIDSLQPCLQQTVILRYYKGWKIHEIAEYLHLPNNTVKGQLYHARKKMQSNWTRA